MRYATMCRHLQAACAAGALALSFAATPGTALGADDKTYVMKITLPTIHDTLEQYSRNFAAAIEKDSGGRIKGEVYPASQLGAIPRQIEAACSSSAIQVAVMPPEFYVGVDERFEIMAAPGLVNSLEHGLRVVQDPSVQKLMLGLGATKGLHGVGLFVASPSSVITKTLIRRLADFKGKQDPHLHLGFPVGGDAAAWRHADRDDLGRRSAGDPAGRDRRRRRRHAGLHHHALPGRGEIRH